MCTAPAVFVDSLYITFWKKIIVRGISMNLYGVYDEVAEDYIGFFSAKNDDVAIRGLGGLEKNDPRNSDDFILVCIGKLDSYEIKHYVSPDGDEIRYRIVGSIHDLVGGSDNE